MSRKIRHLEKGCEDVIKRVENVIYASKGPQHLEDELWSIINDADNGKFPGFLPVKDLSKYNHKKNHNHPVPFEKGQTDHASILNLFIEARRQLRRIAKNHKSNKVSSIHNNSDDYDYVRLERLVPLRRKFGEALIEQDCLSEVIEKYGLRFSVEMILEAAWLQAANDNILLGRKIEYIGGTMRRSVGSAVIEDGCRQLYGRKPTGKPSENADVIANHIEASRITTNIEAISNPSQQKWVSSLADAFAVTYNKSQEFSCESLDIQDILNTRDIPFSELIITSVEHSDVNTFRFLAYGYK